MTAHLDELLTARFARQDDPALHPGVPFELVRSRAGQIERMRRRRRRLKLLAFAAMALLVAVPGIAISRTLVDHFFGKPADPGLRDYIGLVLPVRPGSSFATPPRYVAGVRTTRGLVLLWAARRHGGTQCVGVEAAFGDADSVRLKLAGRTIADNGTTCGSRGPSQIGSFNAGLTDGQGLGSVHVLWGQVPARVHAVRLTFEDGGTKTATAQHGWVVAVLEGPTRLPGHRPILEQALDARGHPIATEQLNPWNYGGKEPPLPSLSGAGSSLLMTVATPSGPAQLRLSAPGRGWQRRQCWGLVLNGHSIPILCDYPADVAPAPRRPAINQLYLYGPSFPALVVAIAGPIDHAWLVAADHSVRPVRFVRLRLGFDGRQQAVLLAPTRRGPHALAGVVTSRNGRIVGALLMTSYNSKITTTAPCFLAAPSAGAPAATPACLALMATARRATRPPLGRARAAARRRAAPSTPRTPPSARANGDRRRRAAPEPTIAASPGP